MGRQKKGDFVFTEEAILQKLRVGYMSNPRYAVANLHVFGWESDFLVKTKAGYWYEVEVKISRDDFRNDRKHKAEKYDVLEGRREGLRPNYFSYCVPENLFEKVKDLIPDYAGVVVITDSGYVRQKYAPARLHSDKLSNEQLELTEKFYWNYANLRFDTGRIDAEARIKQLKGYISFLKAEYQAATGYPIEDIF